MKPSSWFGKTEAIKQVRALCKDCPQRAPGCRKKKNRRLSIYHGIWI